MRALIKNPIFETHHAFNALCEKGGGVGGGPARIKVLELLKKEGQALNKIATKEMTEHLGEFPSANPWYVCFAVGLSWGHLAQLELEFTEAVVDYLTNGGSSALKRAQKYPMERGPEPIMLSLIGAQFLFGKVTLPASLPSNLEQLGRAQERWLSQILNPSERPRYIGAWNATAMFMTALFAQPLLAATHIKGTPMLPPGGPILNGLTLLKQANLLSKPPSGSKLDDAAFEPGAIYENHALFEELRKPLEGWSLIDVHSGIYMLGTRVKPSRS